MVASVTPMIRSDFTKISLWAVLALACLAASLVTASRASSASAPRVGHVAVAPSVIRPSTHGHLTYVLSRASDVTVRMSKQLNGRVNRNGVCGRATSANRGRQYCSYFSTTVAKRTTHGGKGFNRIALRRRFGGRTLTPGTYRANVRATGGSTRGTVFTVRSH